MMRRILSLLLLLWACHAQAEQLSWPPFNATLPYLATGGTASRADQDRWADRVNVLDFGADPYTKSYKDGVFAAGGTPGTCTLASASATFTASDVGKPIQMDGGNGMGSAPFLTTIAGFTSSTTVTLTACPTAASTGSMVSASNPSVAGTSGSYAPGDLLTATGGTFTTAAVLKVLATTVNTATVNAAGSGGTNGACTLYGTSGSIGFRFQALATITGGSISALTGWNTHGVYVVNPSNLTAEPVTSSCGLTGATLTLTMGVQSATPQTPGNYSVQPVNPVSITGGGGTGATFTLGWATAGTFVYGVDSTAAFASAISRVSTLSGQGRSTHVYAPTGTYFLNGSTLPTFTYYGGGIVGDGPEKTKIVLGNSYAGDVFSWSEAWAFNSWNGNTFIRPINQYGAIARGFTIYGNRLSTSQQNGLVFYDRNDFVTVEDVSIFMLRGRGIYSGGLKNISQGYMRESEFNRVKIFGAGDTNLPAVEFSCQGGVGVDCTNEVTIGKLNIFAPYWTGIKIGNTSSAGGVRDIKFENLRIEGLQNSNIAADLMVIGDVAATGSINNISIKQAEFIDGYAGQVQLRITGPSAALQPYLIDVDASFGGGAPLSKAVQIDAGRSLAFRTGNVYSWDTNLVVGAAPLVGNKILWHGWANSSALITAIDATSTKSVQFGAVWNGTGGPNDFEVDAGGGVNWPCATSGTTSAPAIMTACGGTNGPLSLYGNATGSTTIGSTGTSGSPVKLAGAIHDNSAVFVASGSVTAGGTSTMATNTDALYLGNASAVLNYTIKLPALTGISGQKAFVGSIGGIVYATIQTSASAAITGAPVQIPPGGVAEFIADGTTWYPLTNFPDPWGAYFGTGVDGAVTCSGASSLSRDMHYSSLTINAGCALNTNGWRLYATGLCDLSNAPVGAITANGSASGIQYQSFTAISGANSIVNTAAGTGVGANGSTITRQFGFGGDGGAGGNGGASGTPNAGGTGGVAQTITTRIASWASPWAYGQPVNAPQGSAGGSYNPFGFVAGNGGATAGNGGGDGTNLGGANTWGGGGGNAAMIACRFIQRGSNATASIIQAKGAQASSPGGNGAAGTAGGAGGAGGGGGGLIDITTEALLGTTIANALDVSGGAGQTGGNGLSTGKGGNGGAGGNGGLTQVRVIGMIPSLTVNTSNAAGTAGSTTVTATGAAGGAGATSRSNL